MNVDELDHIWHAPVSDLLRSKPKSLALQGFRHEGTHGPSAAEILVRPGHESLDPVCDGAKGVQIAFRELPRPAGVIEILEEEEIGGLCWHGTALLRGYKGVTALKSCASPGSTGSGALQQPRGRPALLRGSC
jgi:hypothetical protein